MSAIVEALEWIDPAGVAYDLMRWLRRGRTGFHGLAFDFVEEDVPGQAGTRLVEVTTGPGEVTLRLLLELPTIAALWRERRVLSHLFDPTRGDGRLRSTAPDGAVRELHCRHRGRLDFEEDPANFNREPAWQWCTPTLRAHDPFWYDAAERVATYAAAGTLADWFPLPPLRLVTSSVFATPTIDNPGAVATWPRWIITGPGVDPALTNATTGETLRLGGTLGAGETIAIDTRPGAKTVEGSDGTNRYPQDGSTLWALVPGVNSVEIQMTNATADSRVQLNFTPAYREP